jgi:hypothetical protein
MAGVLNITMAVDDSPTRLAADLVACSNERRLVERFIEHQLRKGWNGRPNKFSIRVDSATAGVSQDVLESATATATLSFADITATENFFVGAVIFAWAASAANEDEITIGADLAAATTNFVNAINAHSKLRGIISATGNTSTGVITLTFHGGPRMAKLVVLFSLDAGVVFSAGSFAGDTTDAYASAAYTYSAGIL